MAGLPHGSSQRHLLTECNLCAGAAFNKRRRLWPHSHKWVSAGAASAAAKSPPSPPTNGNFELLCASSPRYVVQSNHVASSRERTPGMTDLTAIKSEVHYVAAQPGWHVLYYMRGWGLAGYEVHRYPVIAWEILPRDSDDMADGVRPITMCCEATALDCVCTTVARPDGLTQRSVDPRPIEESKWLEDCLDRFPP